MNEVQVIVSPKKAYELEQQFRIVKKSIDARQRELKVHLTLLADDQGHYVPLDSPLTPSSTNPLTGNPSPVTGSPSPVSIIGAGPAGLFAALTLIEHGIKPIIYERGKEVGERKKDIALLNRNMGLNPESNYCFGEGGAGTFSDGKLFSRSKKRGNMQRVMEIFHYFGASDRVLYETHAHIGSDRLPSIIRRIREYILAHGGEIHFNTKIDSLSSLTATRSWAQPIILAIGHSAHDTYRMLAKEGVQMETKGFAMGVRIEHPQSLINRLMYHLGESKDRFDQRQKTASLKVERTLTLKDERSLIDLVGNASYSLVTQVNGRGVYSFCMCPGGHIVPAGSENGLRVVNGMSASHRNSPYANSGMVVEIRPEDIPGDDPLRGLEYQEALERLAYSEAVLQQSGPTGEAGPTAQRSAVAPAQRMKDFVEGKASKDLPSCSYLPGLVNSRLDQWLPAHIGPRLQQGFRDFDRKYPGFLTNEAVIVGVESRSSSPVRIIRDKESMQSLSHPWLYPCGEGAGYAGGITSSALDGINAALAIIKLWNEQYN